MEYGIGGHAIQGQANVYAQAQNQSIGAPAPLTLTRAISGLENVNSRLGKLSENIRGIAQQVGGPYPSQVGEKAAGGVTGGPPNAMALLNMGVDAAHELIADLETSVEAIRRSLGG